MMPATFADSHTTNSLLALAEQEISTSGDELAGAYRKATRALVRHFPEGQLLFTDFNIRTLRDWIVAMLCAGCSLQTVLYYLENVAAIYNKGVRIGLAPKTDAFRQLKAELLAADGETVSRTVKDSLNALSRLAKGRARMVGEMQYYADLLLFSFYTRGLSIAEMLSLTAADLPGLPPEADAIAQRYREPRRRSIFPRGAIANVEQRTKMIAHHAGIDTPPDMSVGQITGRLWILAALRLGIPAESIAGCRMPGSADLAILSFAETAATELPEDEIRDITRRVAASISSNPLHWHVMKLRPRHTYDEVRSRLSTARFKHIDYFYPHDEISRRIGKRLEFRQKPILPYVLFFRSKDTDIAPMFKHIGDLAWCYRNNRRGAYAEIPRHEMERFQRTIGSFTPDFEVTPLGTTETLGIGRRVRVTGGPMAGYEGEIYDIADPAPAVSANVTNSPAASADDSNSPVASADVTNTPAASADDSNSPAASAERSAPAVKLFRLHVLADNGIEWKMTIDARQLEPLD